MNTIAIIGAGLMGYPMAERLLGSNFEVRIFNRTRSKAEALVQKGAILATTPAEAVQGADCVFLMLSDAAAIRQTLFESTPTPELKWRTVIQSGTISPGESIDIQRRITEAGGDYLEAPVLGGPAQMKIGDLIVMVGSTPDQFENWRTLLAFIGHEPIHVGSVGKAAAMKLALNQLIVSHITAFSLSFGFIEQHGIDPELFMKILRRSALYAPMFDNKLSRIVDRDFSNPNFPIKHLFKDIKLFLEQAREISQATGKNQINTDVLEAIRDLLKSAINQGLAESDYSALSEQVRKISPLPKGTIKNY